MSFVHGPIQSTHLTLPTVIPNVDTIESWKAQGFRIETRITQWLWREWSQDLYLNQQKYKAIFTPKYCRISSGNERTSSRNCEVFSLFYQSVEAWRDSSAISKFLSADSVVLCCAMESLVESVLSPCNAELQSMIESACRANDLVCRITERLIHFELDSIERLLFGHTDWVEKMENNRLSFLNAEELIFIFHS